MASSATNNTTTTVQPARSVPGTQIPCYRFDSNQDMARHVALSIANIIRERNAVGQNAVLGLPTGSTPMSIYRELVRMHRDEGLDFSGVVTFNLDEYYGLFKEVLLEPAFSEEDFTRVKNDYLNYIKTSLRYSQDEEPRK